MKGLNCALPLKMDIATENGAGLTEVGLVPSEDCNPILLSTTTSFVSRSEAYGDTLCMIAFLDVLVQDALVQDVLVRDVLVRDVLVRDVLVRREWCGLEGPAGGENFFASGRFAEDATVF